MTAEELWKKYCEDKKIDPQEKYAAWAFCGGGPMADELLKLVLEGKKFGTASMYEDYLNEGEEIPGQREYSVILNAKEEAACVARNYEVRVEPFERVSDYHGYSEGEEERNLEAWRRIHSAYWLPDFQRLQIQSAKDCRAVLEKFTVEYLAPDYIDSGYKTEDCYLIEPNIRYADQIRAYREEMLENNSTMDGCLSLKRMPDPEEWVEYAYDWGNPLRTNDEKRPKGTLLMCIRKDDDKLVGMIQMQKFPEGHPLEMAGNIGYSVRPGERCKGYAKWMLGKILPFVKYGMGLPNAELSVLPDNEASRKTIVANGGVYRDTVFLERDQVTLDRYLIELD